MNNSFFDKVMTWNNKSIDRHNNISIINLQGLDESSIKKVFNQLAQICQITPDAEFSIYNGIINVTTKYHNITIDKFGMVIENKRYTIVYSPSEDNLLFQIVNTNGYYVYNNDTLTFYDRTSYDYAKQYKKRNHKRKNIIAIFNELNIKPVKSTQVSFNTLELIRLFEIIKGNKKPDLIIEAENNNSNIDEERRTNSNRLFNTNGYIVKAIDDGDVEEMAITIKSKKNPESQITLRIYSINGLGSYILVDKEEKEFEKLYLELINNIFDNDSDAELTETPEENNSVIYTKHTLQSEELLKILNVFVPEEEIEYISAANEIANERYFRSENEEIKRHNEARALLKTGYKKALDLFQGKGKGQTKS